MQHILFKVMPGKAYILARCVDCKQDACFRRHDMVEVGWLIMCQNHPGVGRLGRLTQQNEYRIFCLMSCLERHTF